MRILFLGNNWVGWQVVEWLRGQGEEIVGLAVHPEGRSRYREEIRHASGVAQDCMIDGSKLAHPDAAKSVAALQPEIAISVLFGYILRPQFISLFPRGVINLHPAFLPYNRGANPNVWSIVDGTPAGATLHYIDAGVDTGDIIARQLVSVEPIDTGETLYRKLERACVELFKESWALIRSGRLPRVKQDVVNGSTHRMKDLSSIDQIDLERTYTARELINIIRARTFTPYPGVYFLHEGRKVHLRLQLHYADEGSVCD